MLPSSAMALTSISWRGLSRALWNQGVAAGIWASLAYRLKYRWMENRDLFYILHPDKTAQPGPRGGDGTRIATARHATDSIHRWSWATARRQDQRCRHRSCGAGRRWFDLRARTALL